MKKVQMNVKKEIINLSGKDKLVFFFVDFLWGNRLCSDRQIIDDSNDLHSRLFDLSRMNHVVTQFHENGNLLGEFTRQIDKFKIKIDDIIRVSSQMPRDAELLEAR